VDLFAEQVWALGPTERSNFVNNAVMTYVGRSHQRVLDSGWPSLPTSPCSCEVVAGHESFSFRAPVLLEQMIAAGAALAARRFSASVLWLGRCLTASSWVVPWGTTSLGPQMHELPYRRFWSAQNRQKASHGDQPRKAMGRLECFGIMVSDSMARSAPAATAGALHRNGAADQR